MKYADVIIPLSLPVLYSYEIPDGVIISTGCRVIVSFRSNKVYTGIVFKVHDKKPEYGQIKSIKNLTSDKPFLLNTHLSFWEWLSDYYMCSLGDIMNAAMPSGLRPDSDHFNNTENNLITDVRFSDIDCFKPKFERRLVFHPDFLLSKDDLLPSFNKAPKQRDLLQKLSDLIEINSFISKDDLKIADPSGALIRSLIKKNIFVFEEVEVSRLDTQFSSIKAMPVLTEAQTIAFNSIKDFFKSKQTVLLHGVTSSGKTEIYISLINEVIASGKQVLFMMPEIAITSQMVHRLRNYFGNRVGVYHSKSGENERVEVWNNIAADKEDTFSLILGVRSSIFLPFRRLGLIIVDEEHENTYKQFDPAPRYNARDAAIVLGIISEAKVLLGSATPSVESYFNAQQDRYGLVTITERFGKVELPDIEIVDVVKCRKKKLMFSHFSALLIASMQKEIDNGNQVILFQNRRGYAPLLQCHECGWIPQCKHCDVTLTYHKFLNRMVCHYCGYSLALISSCGNCNSNDIRTLGFGTEKIEDELKNYLRDVPIARLDLDAAKSKKKFDEIIRDFENGVTKVLIGTQMVSKGLDFESVSLVGILNADNLLNFPDFRAHERAFQLMSQVSGRAGRRKIKGKVLVQTSYPGHFIIHQLVKNNYEAMFQRQLVEREEFHYPPYYRLIKLCIKHLQPNVCEAAAKEIASHLRGLNGMFVLGPDFPLIGRIQRYYIRNILLKLERDVPVKSVRKSLQDIVDKVIAAKKYPGLQYYFDVDPQ